jgi:hypothetical protein
MNLRILASAFNDLADGRDFYERQGEGSVDIFSIHFSPILIRWRFTPGFIERFLVFIGCYPNGFLTPFTTRLRLEAGWSCIGCWIAVKTRVKPARP